MFTFHPYGLMITIGIIVGLAVAWWRKKLYGMSENDLENLFLLTVPLGIIGARIYHVLDKWSYYSQNLNQIVAVWNGGLGIYGGVLGGLVGLLIFIKIRKTSPLPSPTRRGKLLSVYCYLLAVLDFLMPSLAIGQAIGRWGNFFNQEVFGPPTNLPWGWFIPQSFRPEMWKNYSYFQPTFAYESIWALVGFFILLIIEFNLFDFLARPRKSNGKEGRPSSASVNSCFRLSGSPRISSVPLLKLKQFYYDAFTKGTQVRPRLMTGFYCVWYGVGRFFLEFLRFDTAEIWGVKIAQIISLVLVLWGARQTYIALNGRQSLYTKGRK